MNDFITWVLFRLDTLMPPEVEKSNADSEQSTKQSSSGSVPVDAPESTKIHIVPPKPAA